MTFALQSVSLAPASLGPVALDHVLLASQAALVITAGLGFVLAMRGVVDRQQWRTRRFRLTLTGLGLVAAFLVIAIGILQRGPIVGVDAVVSPLLFSHRRPWLDGLMMAISALGDGNQRTSATVLICVVLLWRRQARDAVALAVVMIASATITPCLKTLFHIARPSMLYSGANVFSFPSGHAVSAAALYGLLAWLLASSLEGRRKVVPWALAALLVTLTAVSRVYVGAHWLSDVLAGVALGGALATVGVAIAGGGGRLQVERRKGQWAVVLAVLLVVATALGPHGFKKAQRLYAPYLNRPAVRTVDPGRLSTRQQVQPSATAAE